MRKVGLNRIGQAGVVIGCVILGGISPSAMAKPEAKLELFVAGKRYASLEEYRREQARLRPVFEEMEGALKRYQQAFADVPARQRDPEPALVEIFNKKKGGRIKRDARMTYSTPCVGRSCPGFVQ